MIVKYYQLSTEDILNNKLFEEGSLYFIEDTRRIYLDPVGGLDRIMVNGDPIILSNESDRENLLSPIPGKLYFVEESSSSYIYYNNVWHNTGSASSSITGYPTLTEHLEEESIKLSPLQYGTELPENPVEGQLFFLITDQYELDLDDTLTESGKPADSKAVGDAINALREEILGGAW